MPDDITLPPMSPNLAASQERFSIKVIRDPNVLLGKGHYTISFGTQVLASCPCITGGEQPNPFSYGGITPPVRWHMIEDIERRDHPHKDRPEQLMARIVPASDADALLFSKTLGQRTFGTHGETDYPFMIHIGREEVGASTGCIAPYEDWPLALHLTNGAYFHAAKHGYELAIDVIDATPNQSYTTAQADAMSKS